MASIPVILGSDWNMVYDKGNLNKNMDVLNMANIPNHAIGKRLRQLCRDFHLIDPYRELYPTNKEFTYHPFGNIRKNRSRLDFFVSLPS